jgi:hypothetical protein
MVGKPVVFFFIQQETLALISFLNTLNQVGLIAVSQETAADSKIILAVPDVLGICRVKKTFAKRKVVDGIEQVCLAYSVVSGKTVDLVGKNQIGQLVIFKI